MIVSDMLSKISTGTNGGTYGLDGSKVPDTGYMIGGAVPSLINPTPAQILEFIETCPSDYVGFWEDTETLALYIDAVDHTTSKAYAERLCMLRSEIAYWDAGNNAEVRVVYTSETAPTDREFANV
jgi:hypothetical protein